ncbi:related to RAD57 protein [Rhynchosporium secalis]|uniref:Related to RAD57 protein n=1 Tax=Rhynchosporium secalis TaxID=38038 RepID=A0A1E1LZJ2_RHYSE|nr:related to RAD57 protein [Rhynchosporium secalis]
MTDLIAVLPGFPTQQYVRLLPSLEKHLVTTADLLTQDYTEIAKRASLPILDVKRLCNAVLDALQTSLGFQENGNVVQSDALLRKSGEDVVNSWNTVSTLDEDLDKALGGGIPTGHITEVTGESGAGKTQFLLTLLLAAQLPAPHGLSSNVLYISTESALPTSRLSQLLRTHPVLHAADPKPTLDSVHSVITPDLESQDHILRFQVPVAVRRYGIRLVILDSVAANYRAEFERPGGATTGQVQTSGANMAQRSSELVKLGHLLRELAREHNIAIVVANQVADRFSGSGGASSPILRRSTQSSPLARRSAPGGAMPDSSLGPMSSLPIPMGTDVSNTPFRSTMDPMSLDHQQRWFTGWGDDPHPSHLALKNLKTPSLGLIWTTQISCRIALIKKPIYGPGLVADEENDKGEPVLKRWRRWMKVVFAPHAAESGPSVRDAVEFEIRGEGLVAVKKKGKSGDNGDDDDS